MKNDVAAALERLKKNDPSKFIGGWLLEVTVDEIMEIIMNANEWNGGGLVLPANAKNIIRALRDKGVLLVEGK